ncbi:hypothetical protein RB195_006003 [Necator americanus]|uniref:Reverse transcriptase domain-containing protein n=1 Tax=Necator americanus TaxID=51031 RepID=A0ABR1BS15_NECAM
MYKVVERIILDRLIKHREETTRDEQAGFRPGRSTIDQVFIGKRVIEIWQRYSKPMQLAFLDFEAAFDSPHQGRLLNALRADGVPGKFVRLLDDMNQRTTVAIRTPDVLPQLPLQTHPLTDLDYADDVVIFAESSTKLQHVVNLVSKLAAAYGLRLRPDKCEQMWISSRPRTGIRVDGQPIELVDELCYLGCTLKNNGSCDRDVQQRCAKATSASNSLTKCLWSTPITNEVKLRVYLSALRPIMMHGSETWTALSTVMKRLDRTERKLLGRLLGYFWPRIEKVGVSCVQGRHTSAKVRVIASGDDISPPIESSKDSPSSFVTDSGISDEDYSSDSNDIHDEETKTSTENSREEGSGWVEERRTIEPPAEKIIVNLESWEQSQNNLDKIGFD